MRVAAINLLVALIGIVLAVGVVEGYGRLNPNILPQRVQDATRLVGTQEIGEFTRLQASIITGDPHLGIRLRPGVEAFLKGHPDYSYHVRTSELTQTGIGLRGPQIQGRPYAVAVGDSHTFGAGSEEADVWVTRLEHILGAPVINMGLPSASSIQYTRMLVHYGVELRPRIVIWEAYAGDFHENVWFDRWLQSGGGEFYDWKIWADKVATTGKLGHVTRVKKWLDSRSITFNLAKLAIAGVGYHYRSPTMDIVFGRPFNFTTEDPITMKGWELMQEAILEANDAARKQGAKLVITYFPMREEIYAPLLRGKFAVSDRGLGEPQRMISALAARQGMHFLDLTPGMAARGLAGEQLYFRQDGHYNKRGNEVIADLIAEHVRKEGLAPSSRGGSY